MERIILLVKPTGVERSTLDFACFLTSLSNSKLTALFLDNDSTPVEPGSTMQASLKHEGAAHAEQPVSMHPQRSVEQNRAEFMRLCRDKGLRWEPEMFVARAVADIVLESRFSDLLIASPDISFYNEREEVPSRLAIDLLRESECPVMLPPVAFNGVDEIVFAYDGTPSSVYSIRQFTHLFPQLEDRKVLFLEVNTDRASDIQYRNRITDYLKMHYSQIGYQVLIGSPDDEIFSYFLNKRNVIIVMGAYGRSALSNLFRRSTAELLLKTTIHPVFITHR